MENLAELIEAAVGANPAVPYGTFQQHDRLDAVVGRARAVAEDMAALGLGRGDVAAFIGVNSGSYIVAWLAAQLAGVEAALINPTYPDEFLAGLLDDLAPDAIIWLGREPGALTGRALLQIDASRAWDGTLALLHEGQGRRRAGCGADARQDDIAAYIHTSGTTGNPKFCALSHGYFMRLGRFFADVMGLSRFDTIVNPLPLFHINPMGNSLVGALVAQAGFLSADRFVAAEFWAQVKRHEATVLVLHGPPASILKAKTTAADAAGHKVRIGFFCDPDFLRRFGISIGVGGYGSTEAGGYCHSQLFRADDTDLPAEGATHLSGLPRFDIECRLADDGEILVRGRHPQTLFSGYARGGKVRPQLDDEGWFHTGDCGRFDDYGRLVFIERASDSIRVNAEYVPLDLVEERLRGAGSLGDFALWRVDSALRGHDPVIYSTSRGIDLDEVRRVVADMPRYMHPVNVIVIATIPRDAGVGKVQRRLLGEQEVIETLAV